MESSPGARQRAGAALAESEIVGAGWGSALDFGEVGGEAERFVELAIRAWARVGRELEIEVKKLGHWGGMRAREALARRAAATDAALEESGIVGVC